MLELVVCHVYHDNTDYRKIPKSSDTQKFVVITLKFELCGSAIE